MDQQPRVVRAALSPSRSLALIRRVAGPIWLRIGFVAILTVPMRRKRRTDTFTAIEVEDDERDRVIAAFHAKTPKPFSRDFALRPSAADHPTFRMEPTRQVAGEAREAIRP